MDNFEYQTITAIKKIRNSNDDDMLKTVLKPSQKNLLQTNTWWRAANATRDAVKFQAENTPYWGLESKYLVQSDRWRNYK